MDFQAILGFLAATLGLAILPGPDNLFVLTLSVAKGARAGLALVIGLMLGCLVHTTLVAFGFAALLEVHPQLYYIIKIFGIVYLLYLAVQVYRAAGKNELDQKQETVKKNGSLVMKGFWMNVLNPKVAIFFLALFPGFLFHHSWSKIAQFYVLGLLFIVMTFLVFGTIALLAGWLTPILRKSPSIFRKLDYLQVLVLVAIAIYLALDGLG